MIVVRPALADEVEALARLGLSAWCKGIKPLIPPEVALAVEQNNPFLPFLRDMRSKVLVAEVEGQAAGIGACEHADNTISDIWVAPAFEGRGAGSALVRALERQILERGYCEAHIEVAAANARALELYQRLGYRQLWRKVAFDAVLRTTLEKIGLARRLPPA
ncbi:MULTISPECIES: GNAT family N-acetyltransferase [Sinorhizobium]|uniref:Acetyltransferase n=1 Tax=Sinorhizobium americanum TaxID=194963 RepID=A0A2S3YSJ0_9HYPH|nr:MULTISPECIES: GNAT family N-acetyltransferase [Sinorhizobium]PDT43556.1 GNAT family N-acetyltransferase [Sinorhizobium sp. FG01]POH34555.1 acetyltransferase [Sinorhizobium americanum]